MGSFSFKNMKTMTKDLLLLWEFSELRWSHLCQAPINELAKLVGSKQGISSCACIKNYLRDCARIIIFYKGHCSFAWKILLQGCLWRSTQPWVDSILLINLVAKDFCLKTTYISLLCLTFETFLILNILNISVVSMACMLHTLQCSMFIPK